MCGIYGFISSAPQSSDHILRAADLIAHRGPDGVGIALFESPTATPRLFGSDATGEPGPPGSADWRPMPASFPPAAIGLAHRRLAIVELSMLGHQPMPSDDGACWVLFNGEIYNHVELRDELIALGHRFKSHSDTEVILAAYREWGVDCLHRFNGMWAIVLIDRVSNRLFVARDRFGVKPLYFWKDGRTLHFASEIKAFLAHPNFAVRPDAARAGDYLKNGPSEWRDTTMFEGVVRLGAGRMIVAALGDDIDVLGAQRSWWSLNTNADKPSFDAGLAERYADEYRDLLDKAVRIRLRADVEVGSALSGGLDSSTVVWLGAQALKAQGVSHRQHSFSSVYKAPGAEACDESPYIERMAAACNLQMNTIEPQPIDVPKEHRRMIWHMDTPPESTCMSGWHTFKLVQRTGIKVTLDGQGADEQLGGYLFYLPHRLSGVGPLMAIRELASMMAVHPFRLAAGAMTLSLAQRSRLARSLMRLRPNHQRIVAQLHNGMNKHLLVDAQTSLCNLIHYADRTSMAFGVESRMPFLDVRLAEFLATVPETYKIHHGWTKHIARLAMADRLPREVVWRKDKLGWPIPERQWSQGPLRDWFEAPRQQLRRFDQWGIGGHFAGALDSNDITMKVRSINLSYWAEVFVDGGWRDFS